MNIYERLKKDHGKQRGMAAGLAETSGSSAERQRLFAEFRMELEAHAAAEEQTFYAALIASPDGQEKARHSIAEHKTASDLLEELEQTDMSSGGWLQKFKKLKEEVEHHADEEEREVFPLAREILSAKRAVELGDEFSSRKLQQRKQKGAA